MTAQVAQGDASTTTTSIEVRRVVGEPLDSWIPVAAGVAVLIVIILAGLYVRARTRRSGSA